MSFNVQSFQGLNNVLEDGRCSIARCCQAVEECLLCNRDNLRGFFEQCFSLLLKQIFGYEGSSWLNSIAKNGLEADAKALVGLLSPDGPLFHAIQTADADKLIKFEFPLNRLPTHSQQLIRLEAGRAELEKWPQYRGHIVTDGRGNSHVHLNVFEYFVFWTAFYVLRSSQVSGQYFSQTSSQAFGSLGPSLGTVKKALRVHRDRPHALRHPYLRMLQLYLEHFLPRQQLAIPPSPRRGLQSPSGQRAANAAIAAQGQILFSVLVEFWLTDGDEPVPVNLGSNTNQESVEAWNSINEIRVRSYQPPSEDLIEALGVLARYAVAVEDARSGAVRPAQTRAWLPATPCDSCLHMQGRSAAMSPHVVPRLGAHASFSAQAFARRLYRFLLRAFKFWPEQHSTAPIVHLWMSYIAPWWNTEGEVVVWEAHILANLPFYTILLPVFIDLLCSRVSSRGDAAVSDLLKVLGILKGSPQLVKILKTAEADLLRYSLAGRRPEGAYADALPHMLNQRQDWGAYATAGQAAVATQDVTETSSVSLFGTDQASAAFKTRELLGAAAGAAKEDLVQEAQAAAAAVLPMDDLPPTPSSMVSQSSQPLPPIKGLKKGSWQEVRYKGDWMRRPLSSSEIGWLVRILLLLSDLANRWLSLDQPPPTLEGPLSFDLQGLSVWLRRRGWRVNLRPLGEIQMLVWLPVCFLGLWIWLRFITFVGGALLTAGQQA